MPSSNEKIKEKVGEILTDCMVYEKSFDKAVDQIDELYSKEIMKIVERSNNSNELLENLRVFCISGLTKLADKENKI